jgi:hypothetical protein
MRGAAISDAIAKAEQILRKIDERWPSSEKGGDSVSPRF